MINLKDFQKLSEVQVNRLFEFIIEATLNDDFYAFISALFNSVKSGGFKPHWSFEYVCEYVEANLKGQIDTLLVSLPRGWGKSIVCSEFAPAWALLRDPTERIGCFSRAMTSDAMGWHDVSRRILNADLVQKYFPNCKIDPLNDEKRMFRTTKHGYRRVASCLASSVGSDLTFAVVDDPANQDHYRSKAQRQRLENFITASLLPALRTVQHPSEEMELENYEEWQSTQLTEWQYDILKKEEELLTKKLESEQRIVQKNPRLLFTMQRLYREDPINLFVKINEKMQENTDIKKSFHYLHIPAEFSETRKYVFLKPKNIGAKSYNPEHLCEAGTFLEAGTLSKNRILQIKESMPPAHFQAQMQQEPIDFSDGSILIAKNIEYANKHDWHTKSFMEVKKVLRYVCISVDPSGTEKGGDKFAIVVCGASFDGKFYMLENATLNSYSPIWVQVVKDLTERWKSEETGRRPPVIIESNYGGANTSSLLKQSYSDIQVINQPAIGSKLTRAYPISKYYLEGTEGTFLKYVPNKINHIHSYVDLKHKGWKELEEQWLHYNGDRSVGSPDVLDATCQGLKWIVGAMGGKIF